LKSFLDRILGHSDRDLAPPEDDLAPEPQAKPFVPPGRRIYSIGDIHGRLDLLEELHGMILADAGGFDGEKCVVYLGDYIDRGAQSKQVLELLIEQPLPGFESVCLLGNHEQTMLDFMQHPQAAGAWLTYGGQTTVMSYGAGLGRVGLLQQLDILRDELEVMVPQDHLDFLASCKLKHVEGSYCFVHAGLRPGVPLDEQAKDDLIWIRDEFIRSRARHEYVVVHGHSISEEVEWFPNRIGIDTGAYHSGMLTCLVLEGEEQRLLQTGRAPE